MSDIGTIKPLVQYPPIKPVNQDTARKENSKKKEEKEKKVLEQEELEQKQEETDVETEAGKKGHVNEYI